MNNNEYIMNNNEYLQAIVCNSDKLDINTLNWTLRGINIMGSIMANSHKIWFIFLEYIDGFISKSLCMSSVLKNLYLFIYD